MRPADGTVTEHQADTAPMVPFLLWGWPIPHTSPFLPYQDDSSCDDDPSHESMGDGVWTVWVPDGVISAVEPSLIW